MQSSINREAAIEVVDQRSKLARMRHAAGQACERVKERARMAALVPFVALGTSPVFAGLPTMPTPGTDMNGDTVQDGDWLGAMSAWFKSGTNIIGLILVGLAFLYVVMGGMQKWKRYSAGQAEVGELKEYMIVASVMTIFIVIMTTYAFTTTGNATA